MASNFQDDERENAMCKLFNLYKNEVEGRSGTDAFLNLHDQIIPFELKTTSKGSVTTVRDFGSAHIAKWKDKHWLIGFFLEGGSTLNNPHIPFSYFKEWQEITQNHAQTLRQLVEKQINLQ